MLFSDAIGDIHMTHEPEIIATELPKVEDQPVPVVPEAPSAVENPATDFTAIRDLVLRAHPEVVPELITGVTVDDLLASIEPAEAAYRRVSESLTTRASISSPATPPVPAGGDRPMPVDPDRLPASEKIRRGLAQSRD